MTTTPPKTVSQTNQQPLDCSSVLQQYISEELLNGRMQVDVDDDLLGGEILDSLGIMWLVAFIEETFSVNVPLEDITIQNFRTIEVIDAYLGQRLKQDAVK